MLTIDMIGQTTRYLNHVLSSHTTRPQVMDLSSWAHGRSLNSRNLLTRNVPCLTPGLSKNSLTLVKCTLKPNMLFFKQKMKQCLTGAKVSTGLSQFVVIGPDLSCIGLLLSNQLLHALLRGACPRRSAILTEATEIVCDFHPLEAQMKAFLLGAQQPSAPSKFVPVIASRMVSCWVFCYPHKTKGPPKGQVLIKLLEGSDLLS